MTLKQLKLVGWAVAAIGIGLCFVPTYRRAVGLNSPFYEILAIRSERKWDLNAGFVTKNKKQPMESTHQAGPMLLLNDDAPFSMKWHVMDGGGKRYRFRFVLLSEGGMIGWVHEGSNTVEDAVTKETIIDLPTSNIQHGDRYMVIGRFLDEAGKVVQIPSKLFIRKRVLMPGDSIVVGVVSSRLFIVGAFLLLSGIAVSIAASMRTLQPMDR